MPDPLIQAGNQAVQNTTPSLSLMDGSSYNQQTGQQIQVPTQNSTSPTVMSPTQAFGNSPIPVPTVTSPDMSGAIVGGVNKTVNDYTASLTPATTPLDNQNQGILNDIASLTGQDANKGIDTLTSQQNAGIDQKQQALKDAQNELVTKTASYNKLEANLGGNNSVETSAVLAAQNAGLMKAKAADLGITQASITAAQGNLSLAIQQVTDAINLKYSTIENQIKTKQAQLAAITPQLDKEQKIQALAQQQVLKDQADQVAQHKSDQVEIHQTMLQAAQNGASKGVMTQIQNAKNPADAIALATPYLAKAQTQVVEVNGHSILIDSQTGKTLQDLGKANSVITSEIAHGGAGVGREAASITNPTTDAGVKAIIAANPGQYGNAADAIDAKYGKGTASLYDSQLQAIYNNNQDVNSVFGGSTAPSIVQPYLNTASNGTKYVDASSIQGTPTQKTAIIQAATKAGLKVITNKNTAADLVNIQDAKSKLDTIGTIFSSISQPDALSRDLYGLGMTKFATMAQTDTQQASAGALQSVGLDILKAISGVQGFRGNQSAIQQVTDHLPSIYDTKDVVAQKINYINQLISDRENAALGTPKQNNTSKSSQTYTTKSGKSFDYQGAIKAGATPAEIQAFLNAN